MKNLSLVIIFASLLCSCAQKQNKTEYNTQWAFCETDTVGRVADVFFVCPTVYKGNADTLRMPIDDEDARYKFVGATNMERGIYDEQSRFFAPYYSQASMYSYTIDPLTRDSVISEAYKEVSLAFSDYLENYNNDNPIILAGFSQGADLCIRLMKEYGKESKVADKIIACYAIGWSLTRKDVEENPWLKPASSETDLGSIITFSSEAPYIEKSIIIPEDVWSYSINPLTWTTSCDTISKENNIGACFTNYSAEITKEIPQLTGAYIDAKRGALKVMDVTAEEYPALLRPFEPGEFHIYDYQFFYRNLQENVRKRIVAYKELSD